MIFVNFKAYSEATGQAALKLISILEEVAVASKIKIIPVVQATDVKEAIQSSKLEIWVQNIDPVEPGAHTGAILAEAVFQDGATGTFLNHSEHKFTNFDDLKRAVDRASLVGLKTLVFASNLAELKKVLPLKPTLVAYEPPELIGSQESSVAKEKSEIIAQAVEICKQASLALIVGAGIKSSEDVKKSLALGAVGVAVASDVVKSQEPKTEILDLVKGFG
jgi:triosephosphate isomerase